MARRIVSEEQVKKTLQINSFRKMSSDKIKEFVFLMPDMDKDVAIAIINQFPAYMESAKVMIEQMNAMCDYIILDNKDSRKETVAAYQRILDSLTTLLIKEGLTSQERNYITENMILVADRIAAKDTENKNILAGVLKCGMLIFGGALILSAAIIVVNIQGAKIPTLKP